MSRPPVKTFTRDNPCTKVEIHNCFYKDGRYVPCPVVRVWSEIGRNVPKYLLREEYARYELRGNTDYVTLTPEGEQWLREGLARQLELHPERALDVRGGTTAPAKRPATRLLRRTR